jgi:hypothetical protein
MVNLSGKNLPERVTADLEELGRHGLAAKTWSSYTTAERMLSKYHREKKIRRELPVEETTILGFIHWLAVDRKLAAGTITCYLAGIRQLHVARGLPAPNIRNETINLILKGIKNKNDKDKLIKKSVRQPITKELMALLKRRLVAWNVNSTDQRLLWAVATNLFHGAFRIGELLGDKKTEFDPAFDLLTDDIHMTASWPAEPGQTGPESSYLPSRATNHKSDIPPSRLRNMSSGMCLPPP